MFEILHRDWNLKPVFTRKWAMEIQTVKLNRYICHISKNKHQGPLLKRPLWKCKYQQMMREVFIFFKVTRAISVQSNELQCACTVQTKTWDMRWRTVRWDRETATEGEEVTCWGRLFQTRAAATRKARSPTVNSRVRLTISDEDDVELSHWRALTSATWQRWRTFPQKCEKQPKAAIEKPNIDPWLWHRHLGPT